MTTKSAFFMSEEDRLCSQPFKNDGWKMPPWICPSPHTNQRHPPPKIRSHLIQLMSKESNLILRLGLLFGVLLSTACSTSKRYEYRYIPGKTATLHGLHAAPPAQAPDTVLKAVRAGNQIAGSPYQWGGGHSHTSSPGYDCSGSASHVLKSCGLLHSPLTSRDFKHYGKSGPGRWISIWARDGHVFLVVAGLRFDTANTGHPEGIRWTTKSRTASNGYVIRHPPGL